MHTHRFLAAGLGMLSLVLAPAARGAGELHMPDVAQAGKRWLGLRGRSAAPEHARGGERLELELGADLLPGATRLERREAPTERARHEVAGGHLDKPPVRRLEAAQRAAAAHDLTEHEVAVAPLLARSGHRRRGGGPGRRPPSHAAPDRGQPNPL